MSNQLYSLYSFKGYSSTNVTDNFVKSIQTSTQPNAMSSPGNTASMGKMAKRTTQPASSTESIPGVTTCTKGYCNPNSNNGYCYSCNCGCNSNTQYKSYCVTGTYYMYLPSSDDCKNTTIFELICSNVVFANSNSTGSEDITSLLKRYMSWYWSIIHNNNTMQVTTNYPSAYGINVKKTMTLSIWNVQIVINSGEQSGTTCYANPDLPVLYFGCSSYAPTQPYTTTTNCAQCYWQTLD